jgi:hypothetical protein
MNMRVLILPLLVGSLALTGCSAASIEASSTPVPTSAETDSTEIVVPDVSALNALNGQTVTLAPGDFYDLVLPSAPADAWTVSVETPGIVEWMPVETGTDGQPVSTLAAVGLGTTNVTLTDGRISVTFAVTVK